MNRNRLLLIGMLALALGAFVSYMVYSNLKETTSRDNRAGVDAVVATTDIQVGTKIGAQHIQLVRFPQGTLPPNALSTMSKAIGRGVIQPIFKGEFILTNKLAGENAGSGLPSLIPTGMRAVSVRVNDIVSVAGFVKPGTRVDVMLTGNPTSGGEQQTTTVLENVAVIATGSNLEQNDNSPEASSVITLLVSPDDAQKLTLASSQGRIQLALRNPLDTRQQGLNAARSNGLYRGEAAPVSAKPMTAKHVPTKIQAPANPPVYSVEVISGKKKETTNFK